jgi:hypothetical protein
MRLASAALAGERLGNGGVVHTKLLFVGLGEGEESEAAIRELRLAASVEKLQSKVNVENVNVLAIRRPRNGIDGR